MTSRRSNSCDSDKVRTRTGVANAECIRSGDVSDTLTEVLREEIRLLRSSSKGTKDPEGEASVARVKSSSPTGSEGRDRPPKKAKTNGSDVVLLSRMIRLLPSCFIGSSRIPRTALLLRIQTVLLIW